MRAGLDWTLTEQRCDLQIHHYKPAFLLADADRIFDAT
jgi:hypothetical protein